MGDGFGEPGAARATTPGRVMIVGSHRTMRLALRGALERAGVDVATDAPPGREAVVAAIGAHPRVVLVDVASDEAAGLETCRLFRRAGIATQVVALTSAIGSGAHAARAAGVNGVVSTDVGPDDLARFLTGITDEQHAARRRHPTARAVDRVLTRREEEVLALAARGLTDGQISRALYISYKTVKNHLHHVYQKLGARSRTEAVTVGIRQGLIAL